VLLAPSPAPSPVPAPSAGTYTVKPGDTLGGIARQVYGSAAKYTLIAEANRITDPRRIWSARCWPSASARGVDLAACAGLAGCTQHITPCGSKARTTQRNSNRGHASPRSPAHRLVGSPNFNRRPNPNDIWALVIHATANSSLEE